MPTSRHVARPVAPVTPTYRAPRGSSRVVRAHSAGLSVTAYSGDGAVLLAFDLEQERAEGLAGFAIHCTPPRGLGAYLKNRLHFEHALTNESGHEQLLWAPSIEAPIQKFRWVDFSGTADPGEYHYEVSAMYFAARGPLKTGPTLRLSTTVAPFEKGKLSLGFTRADVSSQFYAQKWGNRPIRPGNKKSLDYTPAQLRDYADSWAWLGSHAGQLVRDVMDQCVRDHELAVDVFAYDLDEPTFVRQLQQLGPRLRLFLDDAPLHTGRALEPKAAARVRAARGHVKRGHFARFAHDKVVIVRDRATGRAVRVLTGSANFSVRGLYVQANSVLLFDDPAVAQLYADVFDAVWQDEHAFKASGLAANWFELRSADVPRGAVCFSPHKTPDVSLRRPAKSIAEAKRSVMFAVMELDGGGPVLQEVRDLPKREDGIFFYGVSQSDKGVTTRGPGRSHGVITEFACLQGKLPPQFQAETTGGPGQVIHHKFVVTDFNTPDGTVYCGSSNLAAGGETHNGDNLLEIRDPDVAVAYGVEAVRLVDHFHFRAAWKAATKHEPLCLQGPVPAEKAWWRGYYDPKDPRNSERLGLL